MVRGHFESCSQASGRSKGQIDSDAQMILLQVGNQDEGTNCYNEGIFAPGLCNFPIGVRSARPRNRNVEWSEPLRRNMGLLTVVYGIEEFQVEVLPVYGIGRSDCFIVPASKCEKSETSVMLHSNS